MPRTPNQKRQYAALGERLARYVALVEQIYDELNLEAARLATIQAGYGGVEKERPFRWADYPQTRRGLEELQRRFVEDIGAVISRGTSEEWQQSNEVQDLLCDDVLRAYGAQIDGERRRVLYQTNSEALAAFQQRRDRGMNLSQKLWQQADGYKEALEEAISCAIHRGVSAVTLSKQLSRYLRDFHSLRRDYGERFGRASRAGDCEYRSIRLARSEINMAYREAENRRWEQMDFVVGYEIKLSGRHSVEDICDRLKGRYPKSFRWTGWHPNDLCYKVPILSTEEEFWAWMEGREVRSRNEVSDVPEGFKQWINENIHRAKSWGSTPYFIRDNGQYIREDFKVNVYNKTEKSFVRKRRTNLAMSRVEYYIKTYPNIPEVQQAAVNAYTQPVEKDNNGATSREINRRLRLGTEDEYVRTASRLISQALDKLPKFVGTVYRGETMSMSKLRERFLDHLGEVIADKGFVSSSRYMNTPKKFISHDGIPKSHKRVIFEIQSKNGRDISRISEFNGIFNPENQHEILFDKGTKFRLLSSPKEKDGIIYIKMVEQ